MQPHHPRGSAPALLMSILLAAASGPLQASGDYNAGARKSLYCAYCHGYDGNSLDAQVPSLAGQPAQHIVRRLKELQKNGTMHQSMQQAVQTAELNDLDIANLATFYSKQPIRKR